MTEKIERDNSKYCGIVILFPQFSLISNLCYFGFLSYSIICFHLFYLSFYLCISFNRGLIVLKACYVAIIYEKGVLKAIKYINVLNFYDCKLI